MTKCSSCGANADYTTAQPFVNPVHYCAKCLPVWLRERATRGEFPLDAPEPNNVVVQEAPAKKTKKTAVVEEPVAEPVVEAPVVEATDETTDAGN
jgi:hypothetical protein